MSDTQPALGGATERVTVDAIVIGKRHRKDLGDLEELARSIKEQGLLQPIGITEDRHLVFGERRLRACKYILGWEKIDARVVNVSSIVAGEWHENQIRKDFTPSERVSIADAVRAEIGSRQGQRTDLGRQSEIPLSEIRTSQGCFTCKNRDMIYDDGRDLCVCTARGNEPMSPDFDDMALLCRGELWEWHGKTLPEDDADDLSPKVAPLAMIPAAPGQPPQQIAEVDLGKETRDIAAKLAGFGNRETYRQTKRVVDQGTPELVAAMDKGAVSISAAAAIAREAPEVQNRVVDKVKQGKRARKALAEAKRERAAASTPPLPGNRYKVIVCDPPWPTTSNSQENRTGRPDRPAMSLKKIRAFEVAKLAADDCHVFVWATQAFLPAAIELVRVWGFEYTLTFVWRKTGGGPQPPGLPQSNCEFIVYARKGEPKFGEVADFCCCFDAVELEGCRPEAFFEKVRRAIGGPRLEVFCRDAHDGFNQYSPHMIVGASAPSSQPQPRDGDAPVEPGDQLTEPVSSTTRGRSDQEGLAAAAPRSVEAT